MPPKKQIKKQVVEEAPKPQEPEVPLHELEGYGRFQYLNGVVYEGTWKLVKGIKTKHGNGILTISENNLTKQKYEGNWEDDAMSGFGTYFYPDGSKYQGEWKNNQHHGQGTYHFANATIFQGSWHQHLMDGFGYFIDHTGKKWEGEFRNGKFQSRKQKELVKQRVITQRKIAIKKEINVFLVSLSEALAKSDKKTLKDNMSQFLISGESIKQLIKEPYCKVDERPVEKWIEVGNLAKLGEIKVLSKASESMIIPADRIIAKQLEGAGQLVQVLHIKEQRSVKLAIVNLEGSNWALVAVIDEEKKK